MRCALVMMRLWAACRKTSVRRTTGTAPDEMTSASTWPGPIEGSWSMSPTIKRAALSGTAFMSAWHQHDIDHGGLVDYQQVTVERIVVTALEAAALGVDLEHSVNGLRVGAGRLGHTFRSAAGRSAQQKVGALRCEDTQNAIDDGRLADAGATGHDQHLGHQCEPDRGDLAFDKGKTDTPLDPRQGLVRIDPGPRQRAICKPHQPLDDGALRPVQAGQKYTGRFANPVGDHRALLQLEIERSADEVLRDFEQLLGKRYQLFRRQAAMSLIHGLGQRIGNPRADPHDGGLLD